MAGSRVTMLNFDENGNILSANYFTFFRSYAETLEYIPDEHQLCFLKMIVDYGIYNKEPDKERTPKVVICHFPQIKALIDSKRIDSANGIKGAAAKKDKHKENYFDQKGNK